MELELVRALYEFIRDAKQHLSYNIGQRVTMNVKLFQVANNLHVIYQQLRGKLPIEGFSQYYSYDE